MRRLRTYALAVALAAPSLVACGGDDGGHTTTPDAPITPTPDAPTPDAARVCTAATVSTDAPLFDSQNSDGENFAGWQQELTTDLGTGGPAYLSLQFYAGGNYSAPVDLAGTGQNNYKSCTTCVLVYATDADGNLAKTFFQDGGSLTLSGDPVTTQVMAGTVSNLSLVEVTIDDNDFTSTPVAGGTCLSIPSLTLAGDAVPPAWTCAKAKYNDGATCDCMCGAHDPDCDIATAPVAGCTAPQVCGSADTCITPPTNDTCGAADAITIGTAITASTDGAANNYDASVPVSATATCADSDADQPGRDVTYSVALTANQVIHVKLTPTGDDVDLGVSIVGPGAAACDTAPLVCLAGSDAGLGGEVDEFDFTAPSAGTYYVVVDSYYDNFGGPFTLLVTAP